MVQCRLELGEGLRWEGCGLYFQSSGTKSLSFLSRQWVSQKPTEEPSPERLVRKWISRRRGLHTRGTWEGLSQIDPQKHPVKERVGIWATASQRTQPHYITSQWRFCWLPQLPHPAPSHRWPWRSQGKIMNRRIRKRLRWWKSERDRVPSPLLHVRELHVFILSWERGEALKQMRVWSVYFCWNLTFGCLSEVLLTSEQFDKATGCVQDWERELWQHFFKGRSFFKNASFPILHCMNSVHSLYQIYLYKTLYKKI